MPTYFHDTFPEVKVILIQFSVGINLQQKKKIILINNSKSVMEILLPAKFYSIGGKYLYVLLFLYNM